MSEVFCILICEGVQNRPPQGGLLWHMNYFELKAVETLQAHKKLFSLP